MFVIIKPDGKYWTGLPRRDDVASAVHWADPEQALRTIRKLADKGIDTTGYRVISDPLPWPERLAAYRSKRAGRGLI